MKVKCLVSCAGEGYNLKVDEIADIDDKVAEKLIKFGYVEEIKEDKKKRGDK